MIRNARTRGLNNQPNNDKAEKQLVAVVRFHVSSLVGRVGWLQTGAMAVVYIRFVAVAINVITTTVRAFV